MKYIILILILILFIFIFKNSIKNYFLLNNTKWEYYRLGDIVKYWTNPKYDKYPYQYIKSIKYKYKDSIGDIYLKRNKKWNKKKKKKSVNYNLLKKIVDEKSKNVELPKENEVILHLRLGDSIRGYKNNNFIYHKKIKKKKGRVLIHYYATRLELIEKLIPKLKNKKIIIVYGQHRLHINNRLKNYNLLYLQKLKKILKINKIDYKIRLTGNPDEDFIYMSKAKTFIKSGGGYSELISIMVKKNNNTVIDPSI